MPTPTETVQTMYAAFGRGDIATLLEHVTDDVEWTDRDSLELPYMGTFRGKAALLQWFGLTKPAHPARPCWRWRLSPTGRVVGGPAFVAPAAASPEAAARCQMLSWPKHLTVRTVPRPAQPSPVQQGSHDLQARRKLAIDAIERAGLPHAWEQPRFGAAAGGSLVTGLQALPACRPEFQALIQAGPR